jgi:hypothetical protein
LNEAEDTVCYKCKRPLEYAADCEDLRAIADKQENILGVFFWLSVFLQPPLALIVGYFLPKTFPKRKAGMIIAGIILSFLVFVGVLRLVG